MLGRTADGTRASFFQAAGKLQCGIPPQNSLLCGQALRQGFCEKGAGFLGFFRSLQLTLRLLSACFKFSNSSYRARGPFQSLPLLQQQGICVAEVCACSAKASPVRMRCPNSTAFCLSTVRGLPPGFLPGRFLSPSAQVRGMGELLLLLLKPGKSLELPALLSCGAWRLPRFCAVCALVQFSSSKCLCAEASSCEVRTSSSFRR